MIRLFHHDGFEFLLNIDLILQVESTPGTVITLLSGEKIEVKNTITDIVTKIKAHRLGIKEENRHLDKTQTNRGQSRKFTTR